MYKSYSFDNIFQLHFYLQPAAVIPLVQVVCNVWIQQEHALVMLVTRVPSVILRVVVIQLDQAAQHAIR